MLLTSKIFFFHIHSISTTNIEKHVTISFGRVSCIHALLRVSAAVPRLISSAKFQVNASSAHVAMDTVRKWCFAEKKSSKAVSGGDT